MRTGGISRISSGLVLIAGRKLAGFTAVRVATALSLALVDFDRNRLLAAIVAPAVEILS